jgi:hypothetical protein
MGPWGNWWVGNKAFHVKKEALLHASRTGCPKVIWEWHDTVFNKFDKTKLGTVPLNELYKNRAQQLRDTHDHLILFYSGGSDSHNILMTFINNGIKLDQIYVNWPSATINKGLYKPNAVDTSAKNLLSEWDLVVEPTLKWLANSHPEIQIEIGDWSKDISEQYYTDEVYLQTSNWWGAGALLRNLNKSKIGIEQLEKGKRVASIFGFEKPHIELQQDGSVGMFFHDVAYQISSNSVGTFEPFYWTPTMPELPFEMAYQMFLYFKHNPTSQALMWRKLMTKDNALVTEFNNHIAKIVCYADTWDFNKFQAGKPSTITRTDRDFWLYEHPHFERVIQSWKYHHDGLLDGIDLKYLGVSTPFKTLRSVRYFLGRFDN